MTDPAAGTSLSRRPSQRGRPPLPQGPRTRYRSSNYSMETATYTQYSRDSTLFSPTPTPSSATWPSSPYSDPKSLGAISEFPVQSPTGTSEKSIQAPSPPPPSAQPVVKPIPKPATLIPPPNINFESIPLQWKAMPLEAALWTFTSKELQQIVSRAIRSSARESFIRLLSVENLDHSLPAESERLNTLKAMTQSKYRFHVHRRTMLLQALNSCSTAPNDRDKDDNVSVIGRLTSQLSETTAECDQLLEELLRISDQLAQIAMLQDVHWASALAIALRKLNGSYGRRTADLSAARERIAQLEAELEEAWREAERMAREMDDFDAAMASDDEGEAVIEMAEVVMVPRTPTEMETNFYRSMGRTPSPGPARGVLVNGADIATRRKSKDKDEPQVEIVAGPPDFKEATKEDPQVESQSQANLISDTATVHSFRSGRSSRSVRSVRTASRLSHVSAAKRRSSRTSMGSLRIPNRRSGLYNVEDHPPVPDLPKVAPLLPSYFNFDSKAGSLVDDVAPSPRKNSISDIQVLPRDVSVDDIQMVPRTPKFTKQTAVDDIEIRPGRRHMHDEELPPRYDNSTIPSIWLHADTPAPKTPAERVETLMQTDPAKLTSYSKFKTLTKRYSLPFPLFSGKSTSSSPTSHRSG